MPDETTNTTSLVRVHRANTDDPCDRWWCFRRHKWATLCDCGWRRIYFPRSTAKRMRDFHRVWDHHETTS